MRDPLRRILLEIVGRQIVVVRPHERFEEPQVRRATVRRNAASSGRRPERFSRIGWLSHQDAAGARNHSAITGPATGSAPGLRRARPVATTAAVTGKIHIEA